MGSPVRFPFGVTTQGAGKVMSNLPIPDWSQFHTFIDDFDKYTAAQWVVGGVGTPVAPVLVAGDDGLLSLTTSGADNDNNWVQQAQAAWTIESTKQLFFRARLSINADTIGDLAFGLQTAVAANNILTPANGMFIRKNDGVGTFVLVSRSGGVETVSAAFGSYTAGVVFNASFYFDGKGNICAGINDTVQVKITPAALPAGNLGIMAGVQNGSAAARISLVDQLYCVKER